MTLANNNIVVEYTNERIIPAGGLAVVGAILGKSDFTKRLNRMDVTANRSQHQIKNGDIILTYIGMLCMGKPYFEAVHEMDDGKAELHGFRFLLTLKLLICLFHFQIYKYKSYQHIKDHRKP